MDREQEKDLNSALEVLCGGGIILYPTDTIWGIGCDATNTQAVSRLYEMKGRPTSKAMISLVDSLDSLRSWVDKVPEKAEEEINLADRPLTVIYDSPRGISEMLKSEDGSSAFRIVSLNYTAELCSRLGKPLVSTSANLTGKPSPRTFREIEDKILRQVDYICQYGRTLYGDKPSRIVKISDGGLVTIIRE